MPQKARLETATRHIFCCLLFSLSDWPKGDQLKPYSWKYVYWASDNQKYCVYPQIIRAILWVADTLILEIICLGTEI